MTIKGLREERYPERLQLKTELRDVSTLEALGRQARTHSAAQISQIARSISTFGFVAPILIDERGRVLVGLGRLAAAKQLGMAQAPVIILEHLTPAEKRLYVLTDNKVAQNAGWDLEILGLEFADLQALELEIDLEITGFELPAIEAAIHGHHNTEEGDDDLPPLPDTPISRLGDFWNLGQHRIGNANSLERASYERLMVGTALARLAIHDFPYNVPTQGHITSGKGHADFCMAAGEMSREEFGAFLLSAVSTTLPFLTPGGLVIGWMDWRSVDLVLQAGREAGTDLLNILVWDKGAHAGQGNFWRSNHELAPVLKKPGGAHLNNIELGRHGRNRGNVLRYEGVNGFGAQKAREREMHPTCKSVAMTRDLIVDCTRRGDAVIDGFSGSGTTLVAAERTGRIARVLELSPRYVDTAIQRWEALTGRLAVHAETGRTLSQTQADRAGSPPPPDGPPPARVRARSRQSVEG